MNLFLSKIRNREYLIYIIVFFCSVLVTSLFLILLPESFSANQSSDFTSSYEPLARNLLLGNGYSVDGSNFYTFYPPGFPLILAGQIWIARVFSLPERSVDLASNVFLVAFTLTIFFHLTSKITTKMSALITTGLLMTYPFLLWLTKQPNSEIPFITFLFLSFSIFLSASLWKKYHSLWFLLSGLLLGISILIRPIAVFFPLVFVVSIFVLLSKTTTNNKIFTSLIFIFGVLLVVLPWEAIVYDKTDKVVLISENSSMALRGGLVFAVADDSYKQPVSVPKDVELLMMEIKQDYESFGDKQKIVSFLSEKLVESPIAVLKLFTIKALRSWYATDSQSYENLILLAQIPYIVMIGVGSIIAWRKQGIVRKVMIVIWLITLIDWGMTILVTSTLRYMVPVICLQFMNMAQVPLLFLEKFSPKKNALQPFALQKTP